MSILRHSTDGTAGSGKEKALRQSKNRPKQRPRCGMASSCREIFTDSHELWSRGHHLALTGREEIGGVNYYLLQLTLGDGYVTTLYVDPNSWLVTRRRDVRALHVDVDPTPTTIEQQMSDFRRVAGVLFPFANTETDLKTGKVLETTTIRGLTVNPAIDDKIFEQL